MYWRRGSGGKRFGVRERRMKRAGRERRGARTAVLWLGAALIAACQVRSLPARLAFWREIASYARMTRPEAERRAFLPASCDLLEWVRRETAASAVVLLVTSEGRARGG